MAVAKARHLITDTADLYHNCFAMIAMETYGRFFDTHTHNIIHTGNCSIWKCMKIKFWWSPLGLLHQGRSGYSSCCHFYLVLVLLRHCHWASAIRPVHLQCNRSVLCFLLNLSNQFEDPNGTMYGKSLIPNASTKRCPYSMLFVTKTPKLTRHLVSALLVIHKPFTPCWIFMLHDSKIAL